MSQPLIGRTALVTGSGRGIGQQIAIKLAAAGSSVVVNDIDKHVADATVNIIRSAGGVAVSCTGGVTEAPFAERFITTAVEEFGGIDTVVNSAGYTWDSLVQRMADEQWGAILDVHLGTPFRILREAQLIISAAAKAEGNSGAEPITRKVANISSIAGTCDNAGQANCSAAKSGAVGLTKTLAKEWGGYNVTVNYIAYGLIRTRLAESPANSGATIDIEGRTLRAGVNPKLLAWMDKETPLGRAGTPEDAVGAAYLLCLPESDYVSGHVLHCAGGLWTESRINR
ncbi:SDR family oxidoreductase [Mycolicibacterium fortuitum]|uniref:SDR family oxidoreductase n=1 Tax=Mycolicibacterium fortuitum TaxID=1766 RepID=UPI0014900D8A|nr:SDR family oxidoreductase [Mycolicibacterium fortuitum]